MEVIKPATHNWRYGETWADRWRVAADYLKEHWEPEAEDAEAYITHFQSWHDATLFKLGVPFYSAKGDDHWSDQPASQLPRFTLTMGRHLERLGIHIWECAPERLQGEFTGLLVAHCVLWNYP